MGKAIDERSSTSDIADALVALERLDDKHLLSLRAEFDRIQQTRSQKENHEMAEYGSTGINSLRFVFLGAQFVYRTVEILGPEYADSRKPPYEGQVLTVAGFEPHYKNNIVVQTPNGSRSLLPISMVRKD